MFKTVAKGGMNKMGREGKRLRQYEPIQENPYDELKGKIQDVVGRV